MSYRLLALAVTALTSMTASSAISGEAPSVYVAPGGVYIGAGPVYVVPAPNGNGHYTTPSYYGHDYAPPAAVPPAVVAPTTIYGPNGNGHYYGPNGNGHYYGPNGPYNGRYYAPKVRYYEPPPLSVYGAELPPPRPPVGIPYYGNGPVKGYRYGYEPRWQTPY